jgi:hypothetical protein
MGQHTQSRKRYVHGTPTKCARAPIYGPIRREGMYRTTAASFAKRAREGV